MPQDQTAAAARTRLLAAGIVSFVLMGAGQALYGPALPGYEKLLQINTAAAGRIVSAFWVGCFLGVLGLYFSGRRGTPRAGLCGLAIGAALLSMAASWVPVIAGSVAFGAGYGLLTAVFNPRVLALFGSRGASMLSLLNATFSIGAIAAPQVFIALDEDSRLAFGLVAALAALLWLAVGPATRLQAERTAPPAGFRLSWPILLFGCVAIGMEASFVGLGPTALIGAGLSERTAANLLSLFFVAFFSGRVALVFFAHLVPSFAIYTGAVALVGLCSLGVATGPAIWFFPPLGLATGLFFPACYVTATALMGTDARVAPLIIGACLVGAILSPLLYAQVIAELGPRGFFWLIAAVAGILTLAALALFRRMQAGGL